jgi:hypothetical protein
MHTRREMKILDLAGNLTPTSGIQLSYEHINKMRR